MFVTDEEAERRLNHKSNLSLVLLKQRDPQKSTGRGNTFNHKGGDKKGVPNLTPFMRELIGTTAHLDTSKSTANAFGVSDHHVKNLKFGRISENKVDAELERKISNNLLTAKATAADIVMATLGIVNSEQGKLEISNLGVKDQMEVAGRAANIIDKLTPKDANIQDNSTKVLIYAPVTKTLEEFESIEIQSVTRE